MSGEHNSAGNAPKSNRRPSASLTARQRGQLNRSGVGAASIIRGENNKSKPAPTPRRKLPQQGNFKSPEDFYAGPQQPGRVTHGVRRFENAEKDSVSYMLTDEYQMRGGDEAKKPARGPRDSIANNCSVLEAPAPFVPAVRMGYHATRMDAPFFEDNDPKPPRDVQPPTGKRHIARRDSAHMFINPGEKDASYNPPRYKTNRANESVDVLNLGLYSPQQLKETPEPHRHLGPRRFVPPDMPPRPKLMFRPVNTPAKAEHDVIGNGRMGKPEEPKPVGKANGLCQPRRGGDHIFYSPPPKPNAQAKKSTTSNLLRYFDPAVDSPKDFGSNGLRRPTAALANRESKQVGPDVPRSGKGAGLYSNRYRQKPVAA